jgi:TonB family protein
VNIAQAPPPLPGAIPNLSAPPVAKPPQIQPEEKPKLAFETPGVLTVKPGGTGRIEAPKSGIEEAMHNASRPGPGGVSVGDVGADLDTGIRGTPGQPGASGRQASSLELLSDPMGVDFKPYLIRVLAAVRRNWLAVIPESARFGRRGKTVLQFAVSRSGSVPKLVIVMPSGTDAFDRAAVAGVSASNPFPPLPPEFKGDVIRLQLAFFYNVPTR